MTDQFDTFWASDVQYKVRKISGNDLRNEGVHIVRYESSFENCQQALLEVEYNGDTLRLRQFDGDLDAAKVVPVDQRASSFSIWRRIWKVAMG